MLRVIQIPILFGFEQVVLLGGFVPSAQQQYDRRADLSKIDAVSRAKRQPQLKHAVAD